MSQKFKDLGGTFLDVGHRFKDVGGRLTSKLRGRMQKFKDPNPYKRFAADDNCCSWLRPTLTVAVSEDNGEQDMMFDPHCGCVLAAFSEDKWTGRWRLTQDECRALLKKIEKNPFDSTLTLEEIMRFTKKHEDFAQFNALPGAVKGLMCPEYVVQVFGDLDRQNKGHIEKEEWQAFMGEIAFRRLLYLHQRALNYMKTFWGRGQRWTVILAQTRKGVLAERAKILERVVKQAAETVRSHRIYYKTDIQIGLDDLTGWRADLIYYSANNHPLHGIFSCDPHHRLNNAERLCMEVAVVAFMVFATQAKVIGKIGSVDLEDWIPPALHALVIITVPSLMLWYILYLLYTMPVCGDADPSMDTPDRVRRASLVSLVGDIVGHILLAVMFGLTARYYFFHPDGLPPRELVIQVVLGRGYGYLFSWLLMFCLYFNPVLSIGSEKPDDTSFISYMCDRAGVGQWSREKRWFQAKCCEALKSTSVVHTSLREAPPSTFWNQFICCFVAEKDHEDSEIVEHMDPEESAELLNTPWRPPMFKSM